MSPRGCLRKTPSAHAGAILHNLEFFCLFRLKSANSVA